MLDIALGEAADGEIKLRRSTYEWLHGKGESSKFRPLKFKHKRVETGGKIRLFRELEELLYQCFEGDVPGTELYKQLSEYKNQVAISIVRALPEGVRLE